MSGLSSLFEPEELFGNYWHRLVGNVDRESHFAENKTSLDQMRRRLEIFFQGLGGKPGVEIKAITPQSINYRQRLLARMGHGSNALTCAQYDGDFLYLPETIALLPDQALNENIYKWLAAWAAIAGNNRPELREDLLQTDIAFLRFAGHTLSKIFKQLPGMKTLYEQLVPQLLSARQHRHLSPVETSVENAIVAMLNGNGPNNNTSEIWHAIQNPGQNLDHFKAGAGYKTFLPFVLWGQITSNTPVKPRFRDHREDAASKTNENKDRASKKAKHRKSDQIDNKNSLVLHRFESILSWSEMMNIPRAVDDDDEDGAKKAAGDDDEIGLADTSRKVATKLKFDLDLAPQDVEHEKLASKHTYPEWDYRKNIYHHDHCRVLAGSFPSTDEGAIWQPDKAARRRIRAVKRQFEALRPRRELLTRQVDGNEIDMDALIRTRCDLQARGEGSNRIYCDNRENARDLSVSVLVDISRSSESWIENRQVIEISKEALMALAIGLAASGDASSLHSFSSLRRDRVTVSTIKTFSEQLGPQVFARIGALRPGFYTRLGAAIRHTGAQLAKASTTKRLLLVLTDGKPNDLDHYEGRYGIEDTAMAVRELRREGTAVFGITIDKKAQSYFPHVFGRNAYSIINHADKLTQALPLIYRHLVS